MGRGGGQWEVPRGWEGRSQALVLWSHSVCPFYRGGGRETPNYKQQHQQTSDGGPVSAHFDGWSNIWALSHKHPPPPKSYILRGSFGNDRILKDLSVRRGMLSMVGGFYLAGCIELGRSFEICISVSFLKHTAGFTQAGSLLFLRGGC